MSEFIFKLPDLGEGTVEAEIVQWHVKPGDIVSEADIIADVMTDKANVEVPAPVSGQVLRTSGEPGDMVAVGAELIAIETSTEAKTETKTGTKADAGATASQTETEPSRSTGSATTSATTNDGVEQAVEQVMATQPMSRQATPTTDVKVITSPVVRRMAQEAGVNLAQIAGTGPRGRILKSDFEMFLSTQSVGVAAHAVPSAAGQGHGQRAVLAQAKGE